MRSTQRAMTAAVLALAVVVLLAGCKSADTSVASRLDLEEVDLAYIPPADFCSPFLADGSLAPWAQTAIDHGVGLELAPLTGEPPVVRPYPDGRVKACHRGMQHVMKARCDRILQHRIAVAVRLIGGWEQIDATTDVRYGTACAFAQGLFENNRTHPQYAQALAAAMAVYPSLAEEYYVATSSGHRFWYLG